MLVFAAVLTLLVSGAERIALVAPSPPTPAPASVALWPRGAPGSEARAREAEIIDDGAYVHNVHAPSLTVFGADPTADEIGLKFRRHRQE